MVFSNKFNSKKVDPLVEAAKAAMELGQKRRDAIAAVNEEFGVYGRNAVVRENLAAYDARIEEVYRGMQSGNLTEGKKLADKDYDKDGKIESPKDEVWGSRFRAAKKAGKMEEKKMWEGSGVSGEDPGMEVAKQAGARQQAQTPSSTPARTGNAAGATIAKAKDALNELTKPTAKTAMKAYYRAYDSDVQSGEGERSNRLGKWKQKHLPGKSARNQKSTGKAELPDYSEKDSGYTATVKKSGKLTKSTEKATKAEIKSRLGKHTKPKHLPEETIEEAVSRKHFQQVADLIKGHESQEKRNELASHHAGIFAKQNPRFDHGRFHKAAGSTAHEAPKKMEEAAYSFKAARSGKDIGKPGKNFAKIASKAGKEYGSEEKGKKVAGAILAKIRAKHMEEQVSLMPTASSTPKQSSFGSAFAAARKAGQSTFSMGGKSYTTQMKGEKPAATTSSAPKPTTSAPTPKPASATGSMQSTPGVAPTAAKPAAGLTTKNTHAYNAARNASEPDQNKELGKPAEKSQSNFLQSQGIGVKPAEKPDTMPKIDTGPKADPNPDQGNIKLTTTQPKDITQKNSPSYKSAQDSLAESVQVGSNRYRIV